jgi:membrane-associated protease RseP (regulator of RpoE activity)
MTAELREFFSAPSDAGVLVVHVEAGRAGQQAGIAVGDVLVSVSGTPIERPVDLIAAVARTPAGDKLALELLHKGEKRSVEVAPEGGPITDFPRPGGAWHGRSGDPSSALRGPHEMMPELMHRLDDIEQRLQKLEQAPGPRDHSDADSPGARMS